MPDIGQLTAALRVGERIPLAILPGGQIPHHKESFSASSGRPWPAGAPSGACVVRAEEPGGAPGEEFLAVS